MTGTPPGVGCFRKPQLWLKAGDVVECEIDGIGCISNKVGWDCSFTCSCVLMRMKPPCHNAAIWLSVPDKRPQTAAPHHDAYVQVVDEVAAPEAKKAKQ